MSPYIIQSFANYEVWILCGVDPLSRQNDNVDVEVRLSARERYGATFFTLQNVDTLMSGWAATGECASGLYFSLNYAIIVRELSADIIYEVVADIYRSGELPKWFERLAEDGEENGMDAN